jgi:hypothetical protein
MAPKIKRGKGATGPDAADESKLTRIAIVSTEKCKPKKCRQECKKSCPVNKMGKMCIEVGPKSKVAFLSEPLCIGKCMPSRKTLVQILDCLKYFLFDVRVLVMRVSHS